MARKLSLRGFGDALAARERKCSSSEMIGRVAFDIILEIDCIKLGVGS